MAKSSMPEGVKKLYVDEKLFAKIEKAVTAYTATKKAAKKATDGTDIAYAEATDNLAKILGSNWAAIKEASGLKTEAPVKIPGKRGRPAKAKTEETKAPAPEVPFTPKRMRKPPLNQAEA